MQNIVSYFYCNVVNKYKNKAHYAVKRAKNSGKEFQFQVFKTVVVSRGWPGLS